MTTHILKCAPPYWAALAKGEKNFEVRRDDRGFQKGDTLVLENFDAKSQHYLTKDGYLAPYGEQGKLEFSVSYILTGGQFGIEPGYVVLALQPKEATK